MANKITSILFDFDGTLIDSIDAHIDVIIEIANKHGVNLTKDEFSHYNGMSTREGFKKIMREKHITFRGIKLIEIVIDRLRRGKEIEAAIKIFPQTTKMLSEVHKDYELAVATSSGRKYLDRFLKQFEMSGFFNATSTITDVKYGKPAPDIFLKAAKRLGKKPSECVVIEDSLNGVKSAKRAGMKVIAVLSTTKKELFVGEAKPDAFITDIGKLNKKIIAKL